MKKPKVAIIMRTKDRTLLLSRAIESVLNQTFKDYILVIVNDGGAPKPVNELVTKYEKLSPEVKIKVIHNNESKGMEAASNIGIKSVDSEYIVILDDDDTWDKAFLSSVITAFKERSEKGLVTFSKKILETVDGNKVNIHGSEPYLPTTNTISLAGLMSGNLFPTNSFVYARKAYDEIGGYDESLPVLGDWKFNLMFALKNELFVLEKVLANVHHRTEGIGSVSNTVVAGKDRHEKFAQLIRNEFLRNDLSKNQIGLGIMMNLIHSSNDRISNAKEQISKDLLNHFDYINKHNDEYGKNSYRQQQDILVKLSETQHKIDLLRSSFIFNIKDRLSQKINKNK